jgi:hypothetical protein
MMAVARHPVLLSYDQLSDAGQGPSRNGMDSGISFGMHADWGTLSHTAEIGEGGHIAGMARNNASRGDAWNASSH